MTSRRDFLVAAAGFPALARSGGLSGFSVEELLAEVLNRTDYTGQFVGMLLTSSSGERILVGPSDTDPTKPTIKLYTGQPEEDQGALIQTGITGVDGTTKRLLLNISGPEQETGTTDQAVISLRSSSEDDTLGPSVDFFVGTGNQIFVVEETRVNFDYDADTVALPVKDTTGDPSSPVEGDFYVNTADNALRLYSDGVWRSVVTW